MFTSCTELIEWKNFMERLTDLLQYFSMETSWRTQSQLWCSASCCATPSPQSCWLSFSQLYSPSKNYSQTVKSFKPLSVPYQLIINAQGQYRSSSWRNHLLLPLSSLQLHGCLGGGPQPKCQDSLLSCLQHCLWFWLRLLFSLWGVRSWGAMEQYLDKSSHWRQVLSCRMYADDDSRLCHLWWVNLL